MQSVNCAVCVQDPESSENWLIEFRDEPRVHTFGATPEIAQARLEDAIRIWYQIPEEATLTLVVE